MSRGASRRTSLVSHHTASLGSEWWNGKGSSVQRQRGRQAVRPATPSASTIAYQSPELGGPLTGDTKRCPIVSSDEIAQCSALPPPDFTAETSDVFLPTAAPVI